MNKLKTVYEFDVTITPRQACAYAEAIPIIFLAKVAWDARGVQGWPTIYVSDVPEERANSFEAWLVDIGMDLDAVKEVREVRE